jgi:hypothetical protein
MISVSQTPSPMAWFAASTEAMNFVLTPTADQGLNHHRRALIGLDPQSSSVSRLTASQSGFFILIQCGDRPER